MKKLSLLLAASLFALTACAPAVSTPADATAEDAPAETAPAETTAPTQELGTLRRVLSGATPSDTVAFDCVGNFDAAGKPIGFTVYKTDFAAGQTTVFYRTEDGSWYTPALFLTSDTLYCVGVDHLAALPLAGGEPRTIAFDADAWSPDFYSDDFLYCHSLGSAPYSKCSGMRLDLRIGEQTDWGLPIQTQQVMDVLGDKVLITRILSDSPIPFPDDEEQQLALLQNSSREFDLTDLATGQPVQELFTASCYDLSVQGTEPYYGYLGKSGVVPYFYVHTRNGGDRDYFETVSVLDADGTLRDLGVTPCYYCGPVYRGDDLAWICADDTAYGNNSLTIYDTQGNVIGHNQYMVPGDDEYGRRPVRLLPNGKLLLSVGYDYTNNRDGAVKFAFTDANAYLNGSTDYTAMEFVD